MKTIKTWLPLFPGFYNTIFEPDESNEIDYINSQREYNNLQPIDADLIEFDYESYENEVAKGCVEFVENILIDMNVIKEIKFESVVSPQYYNYSNDTINIEVEITEKNIREIQKLISENITDFKSYLKDKYTSRSGFIPHYSNDSNDWDIKECLDHKHKAGAILDFILSIYAEQEGDDLDLKMFEHALQYNWLGTKNYEKVTEMEYCQICNEFVDPAYFNGNSCDECENKQELLSRYVCVKCLTPIENKHEVRSIHVRVNKDKLKLSEIKCLNCQ